MSRREHLLLWVAPVVILGLSMVFYFSGVPFLAHIVCPAQNREWGLLENLQLVILAAICVVAIKGARGPCLRLPSYLFAALALFTVWVILEEMDYGAHLVELFKGTRESYLKKAIGVYNLHHQGASDKIIKRSVYGIMALLFVVAPFLRGKVRHPLLAPLVPRPRMVIVATLAVVSDLVPRSLVGFGILEDGGLGTNIGEFSEVMVYAIFLAYVVELVYYAPLGEEPEPVPATLDTT